MSMTTNEQIITDFCAVWSKLDIDAIMDFFAEDGVWHNIPMPAVVGKANVRAAITGFLATSTNAEFEIHFIGSSCEGVVLTERTDKFDLNAKQITLPVMGTFELVDGKITKWRDYFDLQTFVDQQK